MRYDELSRHEKQLLSSQYPYKRISELFDTKEKHVIPGFRAIEDIEDFKEVKAPIKDYPNAADISFKIGGLKFDYSLTVSFEDFIKQYNEQ